MFRANLLSQQHLISICPLDGIGSQFFRCILPPLMERGRGREAGKANVRVRRLIHIQNESSPISSNPVCAMAVAHKSRRHT